MLTRKRCLIVAGLLVALLCAGFTVTLLMSGNQPGVTKANFDRIEERMTLQEVEQIFGRPGTYTWGGYTWQAVDGSSVFVVFNVNGDSAGPKFWHDSRESPLDKLRRWLHLR